MKRLLLCFLFFASVTYCHADAILTINPVSQTIPLGSQASFDVNISGLVSGTALGAYDINVGFNPTVLAYNSIAFGNQVDLSGLGDIQTATLGTNAVDVFEVSLDSASYLNATQMPSFTLVTLTFDTLSAAINSPITLAINALSDGNGNPIASSVDGGSVSVTTATVTPEPSSGILSVTGLLILAWYLVATRYRIKYRACDNWVSKSS